ncbi:MAG: glycosyltransferase N-terminal domain-containing protein [Capnocytophaga sp.]|nr:glycosyltransferase N-terminal domain-containing protein [Capnocytophaga sp.]
MIFLYTTAVRFIGFLLKIAAFFNRKISLFVLGRKDIFSVLERKIDRNSSYVWVHTASLGEFEQGLPVIKKLRNDYKIIVTFFSPSGYEVRKNTPDADVVAYLPLDTPENARRFVQLVQPKMAVFVKYEFWYHYLHELKKNDVPTYLLSGIFRKNQLFFKWYGGFMRDCLKSFCHFFVQDENSAKLLASIGFTNVTVSGDTRFDRVSEILLRDNRLDFMEKFLDGNPCVVFGSSWAEDEAVFTPYINRYDGNAKFVIAPHQTDSRHITELRSVLQKKTVLFSEMEGKNLADYEVLVIDTVGILTKIYSYASIAYVGGGMGKTGLHNVLEPAVFGIPVVIGRHFEKFNEAKELVKIGGVLSVENENEFAETLSLLLSDNAKRIEIGKINAAFIAKNKGATEKFIASVKKDVF